MKYITTGTLNVRGIKTEKQRKTLAEDAVKYNLHILSITETHLKEDILDEISVKDENGQNNSYILCATTKSGILVRKELQPSITKINDRICTAEVKLKEHKLLFISAYAHTLQKSEQDENTREEFYEALESLIEKVVQRDLLVIGGDFNAKTGNGKNEYPENMGHYGKGIINSSGKKLLETCKQHNLVITNTLFKHKMCHRTTWEAPFRNFKTREGEERKNPVRNQIDYVITRKNHQKFVMDSRSYGGIATETDHKLVKTTLKIEWHKIKSNTEKTEKIDISNFYNEDNKTAYRKEVLKGIEEVEHQETIQDKWNSICQISKDAGKKVLGVITNHKEKKDEKLQKLSTESKKIRQDILAAQDAEVRKKKKEQRKSLKKKLRERLKEIEEGKLEQKLEAIENSKNDSTRYFKALKEIYRNKKVEKLTVKHQNGSMATTEEQQIEIVTAHFKKMLAPTKEPGKQYFPHKTTTPFTADEIQKVAKKMNNGKVLDQTS